MEGQAHFQMITAPWYAIHIPSSVCMAANIQRKKCLIFVDPQTTRQALHSYIYLQSKVSNCYKYKSTQPSQFVSINKLIKIPLLDSPHSSEVWSAKKRVAKRKDSNLTNTK